MCGREIVWVVNTRWLLRQKHNVTHNKKKNKGITKLINWLLTFSVTDYKLIPAALTV